MRRGTLLLLLSSTFACDPASTEVGDERDDAFPSNKADGGVDEGSPEALGVLRVANTVDFETLDASVSSGGVGLIVTAAQNIVDRRAGPDGIEDTEDDTPFESLAALDAVPWVGPVALQRMLDFAEGAGFVAPPEPPPPWWTRSMRMPGGIGEGSENTFVRDTCLVLPSPGDRYTHTVRIPAAGTYDVFVNAYQDAAGDEPARMLVSLDGEPLAEFDVTAQDGDWDVHHFQTDVAEANGEPRTLEIEYAEPDQAPNADRSLVLCGMGIDNLGVATYPGVPMGRVRGTAEVDVSAWIDDTHRHNPVVVGTGEVPTTCIAKGENPGRILWDCRFDLYALYSPFARYAWAVPVDLQRFRGFAPAPYVSTGASRSSGSILERTSADPGYVDITLRPYNGAPVVNIELDVYLEGDYQVRGLSYQVPVTWE